MSGVLSGVNGQGIAAKAAEVRTMMLGKDYVWGGKTTDGFDCSGFVSYVLKQLYPNAGSMLSMSAASFMTSSLFSDINESDKQPGDLILFPAVNGYPNHIGIVYDSKCWIGSQSSTGVDKVLFSNPWWSARPKKFRRINGISSASIDMGRRVQSIC